MNKKEQKICLFSFDIEEWFQVENLKKVITVEDWDSYTSTVQKNTKIIIDILSENNVKATFFILGWVAVRNPQLVKMISSLGHEVASHGYAHDLAYSIGDNDLYEDIRKTKDILESILQKKITGYRAPSFSIDSRLIEFLKQQGFKYDSSYNAFQFNSRYGQLDQIKYLNKEIYALSEKFYEIPSSVLRLFKLNIPVSGGAYFRLIPYNIFKSLVKIKLNRDNLLSFYLHPWEFEPQQPRIKGIRWDFKLRHYYGLKDTANKLKKLINFLKSNNCRFLTINEYIEKIYEENKND